MTMIGTTAEVYSATRLASGRRRDNLITRSSARALLLLDSATQRAQDEMGVSAESRRTRSLGAGGLSSGTDRGRIVNECPCKHEIKARLRPLIGATDRVPTATQHGLLFSGLTHRGRHKGVASRVRPSRKGAPETTTSPATPFAIKWSYTRCPTLVSRVPSLRFQDASVIQQLPAGLRLLGATATRGSWGLTAVNHSDRGAEVQRYTPVDGALRWLALPAPAHRESPGDPGPPREHPPPGPRELARYRCAAFRFAKGPSAGPRSRSTNSLMHSGDPQSAFLDPCPSVPPATGRIPAAGLATRHPVKKELHIASL